MNSELYDNGIDPAEVHVTVRSSRNLVSRSEQKHEAQLRKHLRVKYAMQMPKK